MASNVFVRRAREKPAENKTNLWYDGLFPGMRTKLNLQGRRGWPDQCYWIPGGRPLLIEFKAEGEEPRKLQAYIHDQLRKHGYDVEAHTRAEDAISAIASRLKTHDLRPEPGGATGEAAKPARKRRAA